MLNQQFIVNYKNAKLHLKIYLEYVAHVKQI